MRGAVLEQEAYSPVEEAERLLLAAAETSAKPLAFHAREVAGFDESEKRCRVLLGSIATQATVEAAEQTTPAMNLLEAITLAKAGDRQAEAMLDINIGTTVTEACFKYDHVTKIAMHLNEHGQLIQFGQTMAEMQYNSYAYRQNRHHKLKNITKIEALNGHCIEDLARTGGLEEYYYIVSSLVPQDMPEKDLKQEGYFLNTLTFVTQATTQTGEEVTTESGFSKGTAARDAASFEERMEQRFDLEAVSRVRQRLGLAPISSTEEALEGILVHKSLLPNGVVDFMRMCDEEAAAIASVSLKPDSYYQQLVPNSQKREQSLQNTKRMIKEALLAQADILATPMDAVQRVWELTKEFTVVAAVDNKHIDARIFGHQTYQYINQARALMDMGDFIAAQSMLRSAVEVAIVTGCGGGAGMDGDKGNKSDKTTGNESGDDAASRAAESNKNWSWKRGVCRVDACPSRPKTTMVGPCAVCRNCQRMFDKGIDPTKFIVNKPRGVNETPSWKDALFTKESVELSVSVASPKQPLEEAEAT